MIKGISGKVRRRGGDGSGGRRARRVGGQCASASECTWLFGGVEGFG